LITGLSSESIVAEEFRAEQRTVFGINPLTLVTRKLLFRVLVTGLLLILFGELLFSSGRHATDDSWKVIPTIVGVLLIVLDGILTLIWLARRQRPTALEAGLRIDDPDSTV
jgi:hypothetical protein